MQQQVQSYSTETWVILKNLKEVQSGRVNTALDRNRKAPGRIQYFI